QLFSHGEEDCAGLGLGRGATLTATRPALPAKLLACAALTSNASSRASSSALNWARFKSSSFRPRRPATATTRVGSDRVVAAPTTSPTPTPPSPPAPARTESSRIQPVALPAFTRSQPPCLSRISTLAPLDTLAVTRALGLGWL